MKCIKDKNVALEPENQEVQYMVKLETKEELKQYDRFVEVAYNHDRMTDISRAYAEGWWDCYMTQKLGIHHTGGDTYYYFTPLENTPEVGETFELDDIKWERVA